MIKDYKQAEDITQETFIKAYLNYDQFEGHSSCKTWIMKIARNLAIDYIRKTKHIQLLKDTLLPIKADDHDLPEDIVLYKETDQELIEAIQQLKRSQREVILLRKIKHFSVQETAEILGWSKSKVKVTLHRAINNLEKNFLKGESVHELF